MVTASILSTVLLALSTQARTAQFPGGMSRGIQDTTEVIVVGTVHGDHAVNDAYSAETLRDIVVALQPAAILIELPPTINGRPTVVNGRRAAWLAGANEGWAENAAADALGVPVAPFDREGRNEYYVRTNYFARRDSASARLASLAAHLRAENAAALVPLLLDVYHDINRSQQLLHRTAPPEVINSAAFDELIQAKRRMDQDVVLHLDTRPDLVDEYRFLRTEWLERNDIMARNIRRIAAEYRGARLVVLTGSEHRYLLRRLLAEAEGIVVREYWEVVPDATPQRR
jgi:hypothetical protein